LQTVEWIKSSDFCTQSLKREGNLELSAEVASILDGNEAKQNENEELLRTLCGIYGYKQHALANQLEEHAKGEASHKEAVDANREIQEFLANMTTE
jgi:hypothetical protein